MLAFWLILHIVGAPPRTPVIPVPAQFLVYALGIAGLLATVDYGHFGPEPGDGSDDPNLRVLAWPWYVPLGSVIAFVWGYLLAGRKMPDGGNAPIPSH